MPRTTNIGRSGSTTDRAASEGDAPILLVEGCEYPAGLEALIAADGHTLQCVGDLGEAASLLMAGRARAVLITAGRAFSHKDLLALRLCRTAAPSAAVVMVTTEPPTAWPDVKRALESGATAFLRWPTLPHVVRQALGSGAPGVPPERSELGCARSGIAGGRASASQEQPRKRG
jgi:hypothetical protein